MAEHPVGTFNVARGVFDHPVFAREPFTEREAWLWLIAEAQWKPVRKRVGRVIIALDFAVLLSILLGSSTIRKDIALHSAQFKPFLGVAHPSHRVAMRQ
jgi:hypothetical protein